MLKAHRLLAVDRGDLPKLGVLAPTFAFTSACTVVIASLSKALFLAANPIALLPAMFLGSAAITAVGSLVYVALMRKFRLEVRFPALLGIGAASLLALRAAFPADPRLTGVLALLWGPAIAHLVVVQSWNVVSTLLPTRQGKRLFPVLAAVATLGAAVGGGLVQLLLRWLGAEDLLVLAGALLAWPLLRSARVIRRLEESAGSSADLPAGPLTAPDDDDVSEVRRGVRSIVREPLLADLAVLVFLLQAASLLLEYQLSAELKPRFDKDSIAAFLGTFYGASNLIVLVLTLFATSRVVRAVGIGVALVSSGILVGVGSAVYVAAAVTGVLPTFWVLAATAFAERIAQYALGRPAMQMIYMPLATRGGEAARTLIDGVVYRVATALVSVALLLTAPELGSQFRLSPPAVLACAVALYLAVRLGPHYRRVLFEALRSRRLDASVASYLRDGLDRGAGAEILQRLTSGDALQVVRALDVARELGLPIDDAVLDQLLLHEDERVARGALATLAALGRRPDAALLRRMLDPARPPRVLRAILQLLGGHADGAVADIARPLVSHPDLGVASAATVLRLRAAGERAVAGLDEEVEKGRGAAAHRVTGMTRAGDFARELPELLSHPDERVRRETVGQMAELGLPSFVRPLCECVAHAGVRELAVQGLVRYGDRALDAVGEALGSERHGVVPKIALLRVCERVATPAAVEALAAQCKSPEQPIRNHAAEALWRAAADDRAPRPATERLEELVGAEMDRLQRYAAIETLLLGRLTRRRAMFASELGAHVLQAERRAFLLLGILYDRDALHRAFLHYRNADTRSRSNAIELCEQHITAPALRRFVALVERAEDARGNLRPRSMVMQGLRDAGSVEALCDGEPFLARLWRWAAERDAVAARELDWNDELDRVVDLRQLSTFAEMSAEELLPLALALERAEVADGTTVVAADADARDVYWILEGDFHVIAGERTVARLGRHDCFGELAALDGRRRSASVRAVGPAVVVRLGPAGWEDAIALNPKLLRSVIGVLSRRLRATIGG
jgi:AAA family ATP:ADP antiporter